MRIFAAVLFVLLSLAPPVRATEVQDVTSPRGLKAWLVEDHKLPLIALRFAWRGGVEQDPADRQGLATLTMDLLTQGAGPYSASAFQDALAAHSIQMSFDAGRDALSGSVKTLSSEKGKAFELLRLAITAPRFEVADIERLRARQRTAQRAQIGDPGWQARYALLNHIFAAHPYSQRGFGTAETLAAITRADIQSFAARHLAQGNLVVAAAGDISAAELAAALDDIFGALPAKDESAPVDEAVWPEKPATLLVPRAGTQTEFLFALPGPKRADADWYAAEIANYILGGGGFSSRLMQDLRDKRGLTYGISTGLAPMQRAAMITGGAATDNEKTAEALRAVRATWEKFYAAGATADEVKAAQDYLTGALPLGLTSTHAIAGALVGMQLDELGRDYLDRRNERLRRVTVEDVRAVIRKYYDPARLTLSLAGTPQGIAPTETLTPVRE